MTEIKKVGYIMENKVVFEQPTSFRDNAIYLHDKEVKVLVGIVENGASLQGEFLKGKINSREYMRINKTLLEGEFYVYQAEPKRYYVKLYNDFEGYLSVYGLGLDKVLDKVFDHGTKQEGFGKQTTFTMEEIANLKHYKGLPVPAESLDKCLEPVE